MRLSGMKKICTLASVILGLSASQVALGFTMECGRIDIPRKIRSQNKIYTFVLNQTCKIKGSSTIKYENFKDIFPDVLANNREYKAMKVYQNANYGRDNAVRVDIEQRKRTNHGNMVLRGDLYMSYDENTQTYTSHHDTRRIEGEGKAGFTKEIKDTVVVTPDKNDLQMSVTRTVKIAKPWYAPEGVFVGKVKEGLKDDLHEVTDMQKAIFEAIQ